MDNEYNKIKDAYQRNMFAAENDKVDITSLYQQLTDISITSDYEEDLYHSAARFTDEQAIHFLKDAGLKPSVDKYGNTALHSLTQTRFDFTDPQLEEKSVKIYRTALALIDAGINPKKKNDSGKLPYFEAGLLICTRF